MDLLDFSFAEFSNVEHCAVLRQASISESVQAANFENPYRGLASCFCGLRLGNPAVTRPVSVAFFWTLRADCSFSIYEENWRRNFASEQLRFRLVCGPGYADYHSSFACGHEDNISVLC